MTEVPTTGRVDTPQLLDNSDTRWVFMTGRTYPCHSARSQLEPAHSAITCVTVVPKQSPDVSALLAPGPKLPAGGVEVHLGDVRTCPSAASRPPSTSAT